MRPNGKQRKEPCMHAYTHTCISIHVYILHACVRMTCAFSVLWFCHIRSPHDSAFQTERRIGPYSVSCHLPLAQEYVYCSPVSLEGNPSLLEICVFSQVTEAIESKT